MVLVSRPVSLKELNPRISPPDKKVTERDKKRLRRVRKHLEGQHDQKSHGNWARGNPAEENITQYLNFRADAGDPVAKILLEHGRFYSPPNALPNEFEPGTAKECYSNCTWPALEGTGTYVEGIAFGAFLPVDHAWVVNDKGEVLDFTWSGRETNMPEEYGGEAVTISPGEAYFGIELDANFVRSHLFERETFGVLPNLWMEPAWPDIKLADGTIVNTKPIQKRGLRIRTNTEHRNRLVRRLKRKRGRFYGAPINAVKKVEVTVHGVNLVLYEMAIELPPRHPERLQIEQQMRMNGLPNDGIAKHASPTHPGTGTDQSVHGDGSSDPSEVFESLKEGGFTYDVMTRRLVDKYGWAVALEQFEMRLSGKMTPDALEKVLAQYTDGHIAEFEFGYVAGGWYDDSTDEYVLDITRIIRSHADAVQFAMDNKQDAIFHLGTGALLELGGKSIDDLLAEIDFDEEP